jgi:poly(A) polymerase
MTQVNAVQYGVGQPLSTVGPTPADLEATEDLINTLKKHGQFESEDEAAKREEVLVKLSKLFKTFVRKVAIKAGVPSSIASEAGGKIFTFGSYRLGVHGAGADIDTLCVAPNAVKREHFFLDMLQILQAQPEITELTVGFNSGE